MNTSERLQQISQGRVGNIIVPRAATSAAAFLRTFERDEIRVWLKDARAYREQRFEKIRRASRDWPRVPASRKLRYLVNDVLGSPRIQWLSLFEVLGCDGSRERTAEFARTYLLGLDRRDCRLDSRHPLTERVVLRGIPRADGRLRPAYAFGPLMKARQRQIRWIVRTLMKEKYRYQCAEMGISRRTLRDQIVEGARRGRGKHFVALDLKDFFGSLNHNFVRSWLPVPAATVDNTILIPLNKTGGEYDELVVAGPMASLLSHSNTVAVSAPQRGLPQGTSCSPAIAYAILETIVGDLTPGSSIYQWADNLLVLVRSRREAVDILSQLERSLRGSPAGPLLIGSHSIGKVRDGFEFNGLRFAARRRDINVSLSQAARIRFFQAVRGRIEQDRLVGDGRYASAMDYVYHQWAPQACNCDVYELQGHALTLIDQAASADGFD